MPSPKIEPRLLDQLATQAEVACVVQTRPAIATSGQARALLTALLDEAVARSHAPPSSTTVLANLGTLVLTASAPLMDALAQSPDVVRVVANNRGAAVSNPEPPRPPRRVRARKPVAG